VVSDASAVGLVDFTWLDEKYIDIPRAAAKTTSAAMPEVLRIQPSYFDWSHLPPRTWRGVAADILFATVVASFSDASISSSTSRVDKD
jgi:hypothetical protein